MCFVKSLDECSFLYCVDEFPVETGSWEEAKYINKMSKVCYDGLKKLSLKVKIVLKS